VGQYDPEKTQIQCRYSRLRANRHSWYGRFKNE
jgi:hypothetical protein